MTAATMNKTSGVKVYRNGTVYLLKADVTPERLTAYLARHPGAFVVKGKVPSTACLERMARDSVATAVDGCGHIEPDGTCRHGAPSWLRALGYI